MEDELLGTEEVAGYLGVEPTTVWRWCREGTLPCLKVGRYWRVRRSSLEEFVRRSERSNTLVGQLRSFLEVPDNVLGISQNMDLAAHLDAAFFRVAEVRSGGGFLVKYHSEGPGRPTLGELREQLEGRGLEVSRLEEEGRLRMHTADGPPGERVHELRRLVEEYGGEGRSVWADFNWDARTNVEAALKEQQKISELIQEHGQLVVKTSVLEEQLDEWPGAIQRRAQVLHTGTIWLSEAGLSLSRVLPPPAL